MLTGALVFSQSSFADNSEINKVVSASELSVGQLVAKLAVKKYFNGREGNSSVVEESRHTSNLGSITTYKMTISDGAGQVKYLKAKVETVSSTGQIIVNILEDKNVSDQ